MIDVTAEGFDPTRAQTITVNVPGREPVVFTGAFADLVFGKLGPLVRATGVTGTEAERRAALKAALDEMAFGASTEPARYAALMGMRATVFSLLKGRRIHLVRHEKVVGGQEEGEYTTWWGKVVRAIGVVTNCQGRDILIKEGLDRADAYGQTMPEQFHQRGIRPKQVKCYASPLDRATQTGEAHMGPVGVPVIPAPFAMERGGGVGEPKGWRGATMVLKNFVRAIWKLTGTDKHARYEDDESLYGLVERFVTGLILTLSKIEDEEAETGVEITDVFIYSHSQALLCAEEFLGSGEVREEYVLQKGKMPYGTPRTWVPNETGTGYVRVEEFFSAPAS